MARHISYTVHGVVQGVGFRDFTQRQANRLGLSGWVANRASHVEGEATGESSAIDAFTSKLREGPLHARVDKLEITADEQVNHTKGRFEVR